LSEMIGNYNFICCLLWVPKRISGLQWREVKYNWENYTTRRLKMIAFNLIFVVHRY
jgi:hypothetical protein